MDKKISKNWGVCIYIRTSSSLLPLSLSQRKIYRFAFKSCKHLPLLFQKYSEGSDITPAHKNPSFKFKDYMPLVFRHLREKFKIDPSEYMVKNVFRLGFWLSFKLWRFEKKKNCRIRFVILLRMAKTLWLKCQHPGKVDPFSFILLTWTTFWKRFQNERQSFWESFCQSIISM